MTNADLSIGAAVMLVAARLAGAVDARDRAAFGAWQGDASLFVRHRLARCELTFGKMRPPATAIAFAAEE